MVIIVIVIGALVMNYALVKIYGHLWGKKEHGKEHRIARGFVAYLLCRLAFAFRQRKEYHQCPQHHQEFGALFIKQQIGICNPARQHHQERKEQGQSAVL